MQDVLKLFYLKYNKYQLLWRFLLFLSSFLFFKTPRSFWLSFTYNSYCKGYDLWYILYYKMLKTSFTDFKSCLFPIVLYLGEEEPSWIQYAHLVEVILSIRGFPPLFKRDFCGEGILGCLKILEVFRASYRLPCLYPYNDQQGTLLFTFLQYTWTAETQIK